MDDQPHEQPDTTSLKKRLRPEGMFDSYLSELLAGPSGSWIAAQIGQDFLRGVQVPVDEDEDDDIDWQTLVGKSGRQMREHTRWLTTDDVAEGALKLAVHRR